MVETLEDIPVTVLLAADEGATVGAGVVEGPNPVVLGLGEEKGSAANIATHIVAGLLHLRLVAEVEPALLEDTIPLRLQHLSRGQRRAVIAEYAVLGVVYDQALGVNHASTP